jgi:hypothetical protein
MCVNDPRWLSRSDDEFQLSDAFGAAFVMRYRVLAGEDVIEVNCSPGNEVCPF